MALYDGNGNSISIGSDGLTTMLPGADIVVFGDSNVFYTYGHALTDINSMFYRLWKEFGINSLTNYGSNGAKSCDMYKSKFKTWAMDEANQSAYNKENTILIFHCGTNDYSAQWSGEPTLELDDDSTINNSVNAVKLTSQIIEKYYPKAKYFWVIPTATDWSKWTGSAEADDRDMAEKYDNIITNLNLWHFPYLDTYSQSGITTEMLSDGIHLGGGAADYTTIAVEKFYRFLRGRLIML